MGGGLGSLSHRVSLSTWALSLYGAGHGLCKASGAFFFVGESVMGH